MADSSLRSGQFVTIRFKLQGICTAMMNFSSDLGISPVLLQAISQTLTSRDQQTDSKKRCLGSAGRFSMESGSDQDVVSRHHILHGMNEHVASLQNIGNIQGQIESSQSEDRKDVVKAILKQKLSQKISSADEREGETIVMTEPDMTMVNVLTALASQNLKGTSPQIIQVETNIPNEDGEMQPQYVICYDDNGSVPSPSNDVVVSETNSVSKIAMQPIEDSIHDRQFQVDECGNFHTVTIDRPEGSAITDSMLNSMQSALLMSLPNANNIFRELCPICDDKVSGYHYGTFTCESCKGFFKRTVQNKKSFVCHVQGGCEVSLINRKKCPACRFNKCMSVGMRLEAIRIDRTRGGRSSYLGCSTHSRHKSSDGRLEKSRPKASHPPGALNRSIPLSNSGTDSNRNSHLGAMLNHRPPASEVKVDIRPYVPQVLTDIMNLESLLCDDEVPQEITPDKLSDSDENLCGSLMQLIEIRLYKVVRWARNLPQFSAISTDDQIFLLQNCWSELLTLGTCWRSMQSHGQIRLSYGKTLDLETAKQLNIEELVSRLLDVANHLQRLQVDQYEYVALKVLMLITPDVKGLKEPENARDQQDKILQALSEYTSSHYPQHGNKLGEMLIRLPELSRISLIGKEILLNKVPRDLPSCGLLFELLKGENEAKEL